MGTLLFVYGTLRRGQSAHHRLASGRFLGAARTQPLYQVAQVSWYPGLTEAKPGAGPGVAIPGELWEVDEEMLRALDVYEGAPALFERRPIAIEGYSDRIEAYFYRG